MVDACAEQLRAAILSGRHAPGERLPPERELATLWAVNRLTLRGALARLAQEGLLVARQGSGHTVQDYRRSGGPGLVQALLEVLDTPAHRRDALADVLAARRALARLVFERAAGALDAAAAEARDGALQAISRQIDEFEAAARRGATPETLAALDREIVAAVIAATGSPVLPLMMNPVAEILSSLPGLAAVIYARPEGNVRGWRAALSWLGTRNRAEVGLIAELLRERDEAHLASMFGAGAVERAEGGPREVGDGG